MQILDTLKIMFHPKAGSQVYYHEVCSILSSTCGFECSKRKASDLKEKGFKDADPPINSRRVKVARQTLGLICIL